MSHTRWLLLPLCCLLLSLPAKAALTEPNRKALAAMEDSLLTAADSMYNALIPDTREEYSRRFARALVRALKTEGSWEYPFEKLNTRINVLYPDDKAFRIFNWAIAPDENTRRYFGAIQMPADELKLYGLVDYSAGITKGAEDSVMSGGRWFGALYYRINTQELNGGKIYTLFGLNAVSPISNRKILDAMRITPDGPVFGAPIFNTMQGRANRFVLEFKKGVQVSLNWDVTLKAIYFDDLVSQTNDPTRKYTYVPSGQVNGFRWTGESWRMIQDIVPIVPRQEGQAPVGEARE